MRKNIKKIITIAIIFILIMQFNTLGLEAAVYVGKPSITTIMQTGKDSAKISWSKASGAKGYILQYKISGGSWRSKKISKRNATISGLETDSTYSFRVRAYKIVNGKKKYGQYSVEKKISLHNYIYLVDLYKPYNSSYYTAYTNGKYFMMGGSKQKNSFTLGQDQWGVEKNANFNIEGKYSELTFKVGKIDGASDSPYDGDLDVNIYSDGELLETISVKIDALPISVNIPLDYDERLTFEVETDACTIVGFSDVKLFY